MPKIEIEEGEAVVVTFKGTDGEITVAFVPDGMRILTGCREEVAAMLTSRVAGIVVHTDIPDSSGRGGIVYHEPLVVGYLVDPTKGPKEKK